MTTLLRAVKTVSLLGVFAFLFMVPMVSVTYGQEASSEAQTQTSCFDFYSFNSVKVHLENSRGVATAGSGFPVRVTLNNENDYPIVGGSLYIKAYKKPTTTSAILGTDNGDLVDAFYGLTNLSIPAKGSVSKDFTWKIPVGAVSGTYRLSPFFLVSNQFDITGLSYSDDVHGAPLDLSVIGEATSSVYFDRQSVMVDGQRYLFSSLPIEVSSAGPVKISVALVNDTDVVKTIPTSARIYRWSSNTTKNYISDMVHTVVVAPQSRTTIEFTLTEQVSVPFIELSAADGLSKTMMGIRFTRKGVSYPRLNFLGLKPSADGTSNQVFACFHGAGNNLYTANGGKVVVSATNSDGKVLGTKTYQGEVSGAMMALAFDAAVSEKTEKIIVRADSFQNGKIADSATVTYTCGLDIPCTVVGENELATQSQIIFILLTAFVAIALIIAMFFIMKKKKVNPVSLAIILAISVGIFTTAHNAYAECYVSQTTGPVTNPKVGFFCSCTNVGATWISTGNNSGFLQYTGTCVETALPTTDFCANIDGIQTSVPAGYTNSGGAGGQCTPYDACPNIDGIQQTVAPYVLTNGQCTVDSSATSAQKTVSWTGNVNNAATAVPATLATLNAQRSTSDCTGTSGACYLPWVAGLNLSLYYGAEVVDAQGNRVDESTKLKVGDKLTVRALARQNDQINWSLVGGVVGTPYGYWSSTYKGYSESDLLADISPYFKYYAPVIVNDPSVSIEQTGSATINKVGPATFVITSPGTVAFKVNFSDTNASASIIKKVLTGSGGGATPPASSVSLAVPTQAITFNYSVDGGPTNKNPNTPTISGPATLTAGSSGTYTINGTDSDGDQVYYDVSFLGASPAGATRLPGSGLINSGTNQTVNKSWLNPGTQTVWARTVDSKGAVSEWASYTVSITNSFILTTSVSGSGSITSSPAGINCGSTCAASFSGGASVTLTATASGGSAFTGWNGDCSGATGNTCTVTMDKARTTTATFTGTTCTDPSASNNGGTLPCVYNKTLSLSLGSCGASTLLGSGTYTVGSSASYSISNIPTGLTFINWTNTADNSEVTRNTSGSITMNADTGLVAHCDSGPGEPPVISDPDVCLNIAGNQFSVPVTMVKAADGNCYCAEGNTCGPTECEPGTEAGTGGVCSPTFNLNCQPAETELQIVKGFSAASKPVKVDVGATKDQKLTLSAKLWSSESGYITDDAVKYIWNGNAVSSVILPQLGTASVFPQSEVSIKVTRALSEIPDYRLVIGATNEHGVYRECSAPAVRLNKSISGVTIKEQ